jgi:hypothetical protein
MAGPRPRAASSAGSVSFLDPTGNWWAVNGLARASTDYPDIDPIWADAKGGLRKNIGPLIERGLKLCD